MVLVHATLYFGFVKTCINLFVAALTMPYTATHSLTHYTATHSLTALRMKTSKIPYTKPSKTSKIQFEGAESGKKKKATENRPKIRR